MVKPTKCRGGRDHGSEEIPSDGCDRHHGRLHGRAVAGARTCGAALAHREDYRSKQLEKIGAEVLIGVRTRNGNLSTVRSSLLVDWSANELRRNAQPP